MSCAGCFNLVDGTNFLNCVACKASFCLDCLNVAPGEVTPLNRRSLESVKCPSCTNVTRRRICEDTPLPTDTSYAGTSDMSCDDIQDTSRNNRSAEVSQAVTLDSISQLLDLKLSPSSAIVQNLRKTLREDFKLMVSSEIQQSIQKLKDEFTHTTDFLAEGQTELETKIAAKDQEIKCLENKFGALQAELYLVKSRLSTMEHMSRSLNVEIQAVPENRNENVMVLFRSLCNCLGVQINDNEVRACRRVAKINNSSTRPRNIIVTLSSPRLRDLVLSAAHRYNKANPDNMLGTTQIGLPGEHCRIFIAEHLSPGAKELHSAARSFAKEKGFKYVWVKNGQVYIRREDNHSAIRIKSMDSLKGIE